MRIRYLIVLGLSYSLSLFAEPLGLPPVPIPANNPQTPEKISLGEKLFHDVRFSSTGMISCATCHAKDKAFTDNPLAVSEGINRLTGTRNAPTVINSAYLSSQFWDGREPDLESQAGQPFLNPIEMGLKDYEPILKVVRTDPDYQQAFKTVFNKTDKQITISDVLQAIASFERSIISGDSPFDKYYFAGQQDAMNDSAKRGFQVFTGQGRCVSCHTVLQTHALFTDNRFHNLNVGFQRITKDIQALSNAFIKAKAKGENVDIAVLSNKNTSELGRFAVTGQIKDLGAFKTPTLRNIAETAPYMHDGSLKTLEEVVSFYNQGGTNQDAPVANDFQSGGIRPLNLSKEQQADLVEFLKALTSPEYQKTAGVKP